MALTTNQLVVGMFNMAAGGYKTLVSDYVTAHGNVAAADALLGASGLNPQFMGTNLYSNADFASAVVGKVLSGVSTTVQSSIATIVSSYMTANPTMSRGAVVVAVLEAVLAVPTTDATLGTAVSAYTAKVALADASTSTSTDFTALAAEVGQQPTVTGTTFTLTTGTDAITGTSGNDTILSNSDTYTTGDNINGGAGTGDKLELLLTGKEFAKVATVSNVETLMVQDLNASTNASEANTVNMANYTGVNEIMVSGSTATAGTKFTNVADTATTVSLKDLSTANATNGITVTHKGTSLTGSSDALTIKLNNVTAAQKLTVTPANTTTGGFETINVVSSGSNSTGAVTLVTAMQSGVTKQTVNVSGDKNLSLVVTTDMTTVSAADLSGGLKLDVSGSANYTLTGGSGADRFYFAGNFDASDKVAGGTGTDTIAITNATINSTVAGYFNAKTGGVANISGIEALEYTGTGAFVLDASLITLADLKTYKTSGAIVGTAGASATVGTSSTSIGWDVSMQSNAQSFVAEGNITGGAGGAGSGGNGGNGTTGLKARAEVNNASNTFNLEMKGVTIKGGDGGTGTNTGGTGGNAADFDQFEIINITSSKAATGTATNAFTAGALATGGTASGSAGSTVVVQTNATINISGDNDINLGTINSSNQSVSINAANLSGKLTIGTGTAADAIVGGSGQNIISLLGGADTVDLAKSTAKADTINVSAASTSTASAFVKISSFTNSATSTIGDKIDFQGGTGTVYTGTGSAIDVGVTLAGLTAAVSSSGIMTFSGSSAADATLANKITAALSAEVMNTAQDKALAFEHGGNTYIVYADGGSAGFNAGADVVVELTGTTGITGLSATASAAGVIFIA